MKKSQKPTIIYINVPSALLPLKYFLRGLAVFAKEGVVEGGVVGEARAYAGGGDAVTLRGQGVDAREPLLRDVALDRRTDVLLEKLTYIIFRQKYRVCDLVEGDALSVILIDILDRALDLIV